MPTNVVPVNVLALVLELQRHPDSGPSTCASTFTFTTWSAPNSERAKDLRLETIGGRYAYNRAFLTARIVRWSYFM